MVIPDLPFDQFQFCVFRRWRAGEIAYYALSLLYGMSFPPLGIHIATTNPCFIKDSSAFLVIICSTSKHRGLLRAHGITSLLDKIVQGATVYFLVIFTGHLLVIFFEFLAPVSDRPADLRYFAHGGLHVGTGSAPSCQVSYHLECRSKDESDGVLSHM